MANFDSRSINSFKARLTGGGARPNLFEVDLGFPTNLKPASPANKDAKEEGIFMVKAAELPASNIGDIPVNFRGRILHVAGDRTFDPWTVTVINNTDWDLRKKFEDWSNFINDRTFDNGITDPTTYHAEAVVKQLARGKKDGTAKEKNIPVIAQYKFFGIWPSQVSSIALDYGSTDTIEEFQVTFQVEYWASSYGEVDLNNAGKFEVTGGGSTPAPQ